jgi:UDP-GlcNAc:undecaprenyl-phosphate/decaprenyl-phosphate GlcNAc-1-phosphate transferase
MVILPQFWIMILLMVFGFAGTALAIPFVQKAALRKGIVSEPGGRRTHGEPTPLLGGVSIFLPFALVFITFFGLCIFQKLPADRPNSVQMLSLFLGTAWVLCLGTIDDKTPIGWQKKLLGQIAGTVILVLGGHSITTATLPFIGLVDFGYWGIPLFMVAVLCITNAINLIDGIDGLAGGICFFAALTSGIIGLAKGDLFTATVGFTVSGSLLGFLVYNFPPASIFMGDGGSMMVGFLLGALATSSAAISPGQRLGTSMMILFPFLPFGIPVFEVVLSVVRRWLRGQSIFLGDGDHLHYRAIGIIRNPRLTLAVFYLFSATLCALTLFLVLGFQSELIRFLIAIAAIVLFIGVVASLRLYRVEDFSITLRNRPDFKFLGSYLWFMKHKIRRAESLRDLIMLLESGVRDLGFDSVEVVYRNRTIERWYNTRRAHPSEPRIHAEKTFRDGRISAKWSLPVHEDEAYNEYLRLTWHRFLVALGDEFMSFPERPADSDNTNVLDLFG